MSELKAIFATPHPKMKNACDGAVEVYLKFEADKVIAEKDAEIARLNDKAWQYKVLDEEHCRDLNTQDRLFALQIAHQKYKRCLAMARWCNRMFSSTFGKERYWQKWNRRWLELSEKFKEAK